MAGLKIRTGSFSAGYSGSSASIWSKRRCTRKLQTVLGRVIRDIERKCSKPDEELAELLGTSKRIHAQQRRDKNKIHSVPAPEVECLSKGKAHKR